MEVCGISNEWLNETPRKFAVYEAKKRDTADKKSFYTGTRSNWLHCKCHSLPRWINFAENRRQQVKNWTTEKEICENTFNIQGQVQCSNNDDGKGEKWNKCCLPPLCYCYTIVCNIVARLPTVIRYKEKYNVIILSKPLKCQMKRYTLK